MAGQREQASSTAIKRIGTVLEASSYIPNGHRKEDR